MTSTIAPDTAIAVGLGDRLEPNTSRRAMTGAAALDRNLRFRRDVVRLHRLGPRVVHELLAELARQHPEIAEDLNLDPRILQVVGGESLPDLAAAAMAMTARLAGWRPVNKNGLAGIVSVELAIGLRLLDLPVFAVGRDGPWVGLPRRLCLDRDRHQRISADGKPAFEPVAEWKDREAADAFGTAVLALLRAQYPGTLP